MNRIALFVVAALLSAAPLHAETLTGDQAKAKAQEMLTVVTKAEAGAFNDRVLADGGTYMRAVDAPINKALAAWPDRMEPQNKAIEPYSLCAESALSLYNMAEARKRGGANGPDVDKWRADYWDKKARCSESVKTGSFTAKK